MLREFVISFAIMGTCLVIHITGIVWIGDHLVRRRQKIEQRIGTVGVSVLLIAVFSFVIVLHLLEACVWAAFFHGCGFFETFETSLYFSLKSYSTIGYGDVLLPENWRLLGTIEGISGVLLCGLSTAFLFALVNALFQIRVQQLRQIVPADSRSRVGISNTEETPASQSISRSATRAYYQPSEHDPRG